MFTLLIWVKLTVIKSLVSSGVSTRLEVARYLKSSPYCWIQSSIVKLWRVTLAVMSYARWVKVTPSCSTFNYNINIIRSNEGIPSNRYQNESRLCVSPHSVQSKCYLWNLKCCFNNLTLHWKFCLWCTKNHFVHEYQIHSYLSSNKTTASGEVVPDEGRAATLADC